MENTLTQRPSHHAKRQNSSLLVGSQEQRDFSHGSMPTRRHPHCALAANIGQKVKARAALCQKVLASLRLLVTVKEDEVKSGFVDLC